MEPSDAITSLSGLETLREEIVASRNAERPILYICHDTSCVASGAQVVAKAFVKAIKGNGFGVGMAPQVKETGCLGLCRRGPLVAIEPNNVFYQRVQPADVPEVVDSTLRKGETVDRLLYQDERSGERMQRKMEIPFYAKQNRLVLRNVGKLDPVLIEDALAEGAYLGMAKALTTMSPEQVLEEVQRSGLRGRGGGGFPTGVKWGYAAENRAKDDGAAYIVCNADEGDPGAYMDRAVMEGDPHSVLEGMIIGAYAVGATKGYIYVRMEYPCAVEYVTRAVRQARSMGFLGKNILGTGFEFDIEISVGAGAFVCGEETALMASIRGNSGTPVPRPPFPAEQGLWGRPTVINNVETWANVPLILGRGADWFASIGVPTSTGTKVFSLVGKVNNVGLVEVPMGTTIEEIVMDIGGGVPGKDRFKAVQIGGPSGGCIPWEQRHLPVDYDSLREAGAMVGSGGLIVMDDDDCMLDVARYFLRFLEDESCGKCAPCRLGIPRMREILDRFCKGQGSVEDIEELESLATAIKDTSLCALGATSPNPVLTTIQYFRPEYEAHIVEKRCPAHVCKDLITYRILEDVCTGCGLCSQNCPEHCISGEVKKPHTIDTDKCIKCGSCKDACKFGAVEVF